MQEIHIESGMICDWKIKCEEFNLIHQQKKNPVIVFVQINKVHQSDQSVSKKHLEANYFYYFRFMELLKKTSSYAVIIARDLLDFEVPLALQAQVILCEDFGLSFGLSGSQMTALKAVHRNMKVFSSLSKAFMSDLFENGDFQISKCIEQYHRIKKLFVFKHSSFEQKVSGFTHEKFSLKSVDAKFLIPLSSLDFFAGQNIETMDVKLTFSYLLKAHKNDLNKYFSLCSHFLAALTLIEPKCDQRLVRDLKVSKRQLLSVVLDEGLQSLDLVGYLLRLNYAVGLNHQDEAFKLVALKLLKKKMAVFFEGKDLDSVWETQVYWSSNPTNYMPTIRYESAYVYSLKTKNAESKFSYHQAGNHSFIESDSASILFAPHASVYKSTFFAKKGISLVAYFDNAILDFIFCYSVRYKIFFPKLLEVLKLHQLTSFDTMQKCQDIFTALKDVSLLTCPNINSWADFEKMNKSVAVHNYVENRDHFVQNLIFYLYGLGKDLMVEFNLSKDDVFMYVRASTKVKNSFLERKHRDFFDVSQASKVDYLCAHSKSMVKDVYDRV